MRPPAFSIIPPAVKAAIVHEQEFDAKSRSRIGKHRLPAVGFVDHIFLVEARSSDGNETAIHIDRRPYM